MNQAPRQTNSPQAAPTGSGQPDELHVDVLIVGSGPIGATYARKLYEAGRSIYMVDMGASLSRRPGEHLKNSFLYQRNIDLFASVIRGHLHTLSVPTNTSPVPTLDPTAYSVDMSQLTGTIQNNQNPDQNPFHNLPGAAAAYGIGGMATHWTCATPRQHPTIERSPLIDSKEWDRLYPEAERLVNTHADQFDDSIRNTVVREALQKEYAELKPPYQPQQLPLAVERRKDNPEFVRWSGADTVLGPLADDGAYDPARFVLKEQHRCNRLVPSGDGKSVAYAEIDNLSDWHPMRVYAETYIIAAGAVLTPQILYNSGIRPEPLGCYLSEQPLAFCQVVLHQDIVESITADRRFTNKIRAHKEENPHDPVPIPMNDPEPQCWIPVSEGRPWHCQIHRDAFAYGDLAPNIDSRLIVDLRWFGIINQRRENKVTFHGPNRDMFGMPQPTFEFQLTADERRTQHEMMRDMLRASAVLGGFLPGSEPQFMGPGLVLHINGTTRIGKSPDDSVVDVNSKVWGFDNLYLGGNGNLAVANASNPTLTSIALAIKSSESILQKS